MWKSLFQNNKWKIIPKRSFIIAGIILTAFVWAHKERPASALDSRSVLATSILITEVDVSGIDAVEIYNPTSQIIDLTGWQFIAYDFAGTT